MNRWWDYFRVDFKIEKIRVKRFPMELLSALNRNDNRYFLPFSNQRLRISNIWTEMKYLLLLPFVSAFDSLIAYIRTYRCCWFGERISRSYLYDLSSLGICNSQETCHTCPYPLVDGEKRAIRTPPIINCMQFFHFQFQEVFSLWRKPSQ